MLGHPHPFPDQNGNTTDSYWHLINQASGTTGASGPATGTGWNQVTNTGG